VPVLLTVKMPAVVDITVAPCTRRRVPVLAPAGTLTRIVLAETNSGITSVEPVVVRKRTRHGIGPLHSAPFASRLNEEPLIVISEPTAPLVGVNELAAGAEMTV